MNFTATYMIQILLSFQCLNSETSLSLFSSISGLRLLSWQQITNVVLFQVILVWFASSYVSFFQACLSSSDCSCKMISTITSYKHKQMHERQLLNTTMPCIKLQHWRYLNRLPGSLIFNYLQHQTKPKLFQHVCFFGITNFLVIQYAEGHHSP